MTLILGIDPGLANLGWALLRRESGRTTRVDGGSFSTSPKLEDDKRVAILGTLVRQLLLDHAPDVVGVEAHVWQGHERSANAEAFRVSRVSGMCEGLAMALSRGRVVRMTRSRALLGVGAKTEAGGNASIRRLLKWSERSNQHQRDAAIVAWCAGRIARLEG